MSFDDRQTYYDVLEIKPEATPEQIREAYLRTKTAYNKDSLALYTLMSQDETKEMIQKIEEAYEVLSTPEKRREYDRHHGFLSLDIPYDKSKSKIVSIDRVPPMDASSNMEDLLIPPATDFDAAGDQKKFSPQISAKPANTQQTQIPSRMSSENSDALADEIARETEWRGEFLKKVRETRRISLEEISEITRVSKTYLSAIEEENFSKLPASVFVRGFVIQIARILKLPSDKVTAAYMGRFNQTRNHIDSNR